ncbi:uncharacterized protein LOC126674760 isoform X2 [Mercurialis annua]|nr:uncharacterized protein LOC126674760 isoform X2 [Mercurialis annua]
MHATVPHSGRSSKPMNGPTSTSQVKLGSDSVQNSASSFPSQVKGKKRERGDQGTDSVKRERYSKLDDGDSGYFRSESFWKYEIAKFTEKGGLVDSEGVEKFVQLMLTERNEKKIDLAGLSILAGVIAATDKFDCLNQFVQLRGLPVFDEWLQEVHKGKIGDVSSHKDNDKAIEEFLLVLLRALDKLPVNLHALQMCNIGKSVNHLRTHKNLEIQKKARSLVDTWKKRVEAEMDARSGSNQAVSWATRSRLPEISHGVNKHSGSGASAELAIKSPAIQLSALKNTPVKVVQIETMSKSVVSPGSVKQVQSSVSVANNFKEGPAQNTAGSSASDPALTVTRDDKSSSSCQSHNNSQSYSSDHPKSGGVSAKDDARSSTAVSMTANKTAGSSSRHRKAVNGYQGAAVTGIQKETGPGRGTSFRSQSSMTCEKAVDVPVSENHKLIVKIPNRGRSPAQSASGGSFEDPSVMNSRASSPLREQFDHSMKEKNNGYRINFISDVNNESWQSNDFKEVLAGSDEGGVSPATVPDKENCRIGDDGRKLADAFKAASSSSGNEHKSGKLHVGSFSSMNALIESCVKYSEVNASMTAGDDVGMNLLASVAAGEISKSDIASPNQSPERNTTVVDHSCASNDSRLTSYPGDDLTQDRRQCVDGFDDAHEKRGSITGISVPKDAEAKNISCLNEEPTEVLNGHSNSSSVDAQQIAEPCLESCMKSEESLPATSATLPPSNTLDKTSTSAENAWKERTDIRVNADDLCDAKERLHNCIRSENESHVAGLEGGNGFIEGSCSSMAIDSENNRNMNEELKIPAQAEQKPPVMTHSAFARGTVGDVLTPASRKDKVSEVVGSEMKSDKADEIDGKSRPTEKGSIAADCNVGSAVIEDSAESLEESLDGNQSEKQHSSGLAVPKAFSVLVPESEQEIRSKGLKLPGNPTDEAEESTSGAGAAGGSAIEAKMDFDLNEADDGRDGDPSNSRAPESSTTTQLISLSHIPVSSASVALPTSITVASAAKRPFVPPEDLLKNRGELGWKGSAATSAFRPAEPRKVLEISVGTSNSPLSGAAAAKPGRSPLDFDLNIPDERILDDSASRGSVSVADLSNNLNLQYDQSVISTAARSSGGLDLDLNRVEGPYDMLNHLTSNSLRIDAHLQGVKSSSVPVPNGESTVRRDFDLNDGPLVDEAKAELSPFGQHTRNSMLSQPSISGLRLNNAEMGNFSSWFSQVNSYPAVAFQSILPERGEHPFPMVTPGGPQRILAPTGSTQFNTDLYRGPVLSSAPAVPFPGSPYQYPVFPFGTNFPLPAATFSGGSSTYVDSSSGGRLCFPAVHSQVLAPAGAVPSQYTRPFVVSFPDSNNNAGTESSRKWGRQGLDLNAGPLGLDMEGRDETPSIVARQLSVANSLGLANEQARIYQVAGGGISKRKEPENGWEGYKQPSWR